MSAPKSASAEAERRFELWCREEDDAVRVKMYLAWMAALGLEP